MGVNWPGAVRTATASVALGTTLGAALAGCARPPPLPGRCVVLPSNAAAQTLAANNTDTTAVANPAACSLVFTTSDADYTYIVPYPRARVVVPPRHGVASVAKTEIGVTVSYVPDPGYTGPDQFTIRVQPGDVAMVVTVNVPPTT